MGRVVVVGLDGATWDLIEPWAEAGHLPTFARLLREGAHARLRSTFPPLTAPAWTSFATGVNPGVHGLYDWVARIPGSYRFAPVTASDARFPTLYRRLSDAGKRVLLLNVPMTYPPPRVNGIAISGLPAASLDAGISHPPEALDEARRAVGDYILYPDPGGAYSEQGVAAFLERLVRCTVLRSAAFDHLRAREPWDFAMVVFNGTDTVAHACWKYMDPTHPLHDPAAPQRFIDAIRDVYTGMDRYLAHLLEDWEDDTTLVLMSDHGFGPLHKFIHVNRWLLDAGFMRLKEGAAARAKAALFEAGVTPMAAYDLLMRAGLGGLKREVVRGQGQGLLKRLFLSFDDVDWPRTQAYSLGNVGQVRVNLRGREPQGAVEPDGYERVRDALIAGLLALQDPDTGETMVEEAWRQEASYHGPLTPHAADVLFMPRRLEYFGFGEYEFAARRVVEPVRRGISGTHRMEGVFLAWGAGVRAAHGRDDAGQPSSGQPYVVAPDAAGRPHRVAPTMTADITDVAPTILHLLGQPVPDTLDGRVLLEALDEGLGAPRIVPDPLSTGDGDAEGGGLTSEEARALSERLRALGYVA
jgi:predicted AlkP superfamily phosphohydrolase/phosphomutase